MEWLLVLIAVGLLIGTNVWPQQEPEPIVAAAFDPDLNEVLGAIEAQTSGDLERLMRIRTRELIGRQVPVRDIRAAPTYRVARIAFSNGDIVLASSRSPGDLVTMARAMIATSVTLSALSLTDDGPMLHFEWNYGQTLVVNAVGLDQAD